MFSLETDSTCIVAYLITKIYLKNAHTPLTVIGKDDASQHRFIGVCLCDLDAVVDKQLELQRGEGAGGMGSKVDNTFNPMLIALS